MNLFCILHTLIDDTNPQTRRTVRIEEVVFAVKQNIEEDPNESICHLHTIGAVPATLRKILQNDIGLQTYKI